MSIQDAMAKRMSSPGGRLGSLVAGAMTGNPQMIQQGMGANHGAGQAALGMYNSISGAFGGGDSAPTGARTAEGAPTLGVDTNLGYQQPPSFSYSPDAFGRRLKGIPQPSLGVGSF